MSIHVYDIKEKLQEVKDKKEYKLIGYNITTFAKTFHNQLGKVQLIGPQFNQILKENQKFNSNVYYSINNHLSFIYNQNAEKVKKGFKSKHHLVFNVKKKDNSFGKVIIALKTSKYNQEDLAFYVYGSVKDRNMLTIKEYKENQIDFGSLNDITNNILENLENSSVSKMTILFKEFITLDQNFLRDKILLEEIYQNEKIYLKNNTSREWKKESYFISNINYDIETKQWNIKTYQDKKKNTLFSLVDALSQSNELLI